MGKLFDINGLHGYLSAFLYLIRLYLDYSTARVYGNGTAENTSVC